MIKERIKNLREEIGENQAVLVMSDINRLYFSGFKSSAGAVIVTKNKAFLAVDFRYFESAKRIVNDLEVIMFSRLYETLAEMFKNENITEVFTETDFLTVDSFCALQKNLKDFSVSKDSKISKHIKKMRSIKCDRERENIKKAQTITDKAFAHILDFIEKGKTESQIALELEFFMRKNGSQGTAFDTIVVSGKNSSLPHGVPTDKKVENGDFITMDFGAVINGYCSDMTRTVVVGGISDKQYEVYNTVLKAQKQALKAIRPNIECKEVDKTARDIIEKAGYKNCFGHGLGHSVGLEIHENPCFNTRDNVRLKKGMVLTVEPGIYIENEFGVRIEDMVYITDTGFENLTESPKDLIIL